MKCNIIWNSLSPQEWEERFKKIEKSNVLQSYHYARAICKLKHQRARWGLIEIEGVEAGMFQILEAGFLFNIVHAVMLDRGPLWFDGHGGAAHISAFFKEFNKIFPARLGRKRRIIPEIEQGMAVEKILNQCGLTLNDALKPYQTLWWNLDVEEEEARAALKSNWRSSLKKAETSKLEVLWDDKGKYYKWLRDVYKRDKDVKGYEGISPQLLDNLALFSTSDNPMIIGKASFEGRDVATVVFICHGRSATYQIGWTSEEGRQYCAHQLLLWRGRSMLRLRGITQMDLGGINEQDAKNIKAFKERTGATPLTLVGNYA